MDSSIPQPVVQCVTALKLAKNDNERFASLFLVTKLIKGEDCTEASLKLLYDAIGFDFLNRLLRASEVPEDCPPFIYKSVALSIISVFCEVPEIVNSPSIRSIIPVLLDIIGMSDDDEMSDDLMLVSDCYTCLGAIAGFQAGRNALLATGTSKTLMHIFAEENFRHDEALNLLHTLVRTEGCKVWIGNEALYPEVMRRLTNDFIGDNTEKKFELCSMLVIFLAQSPQQELDIENESWPKDLLIALEGILCSKIGTGHRDVALQLVSRLLELLGIEWGLRQVKAGPNAYQFLLLLVNLACVEVRMKLEDKSLPQVLDKADVLVACYTIIELFITFMTSQLFLDFDQKQRDQAYCALKGAVSAILGLILEVSLETPSFEIKESAERQQTIFICASIRVLGAWLAEEASSMRKDVCVILPYIISVCKVTFKLRKEGQEDISDVFRFMLPAFCHLAAEDESRKIMLEKSLHETLYDYLMYQWAIFSRWLSQQPDLAADWLHATVGETEEQTNMAEKSRPDSEAAVILVCGIFMNLVVLEPNLCQQNVVFTQLLRFAFANVPILVKRQDFLVLHGNVAVLGLLILRQHSWKYPQGDSNVFRYIQGTVSFLWDAHNSEEACQEMSLVISLRYKKDWPDLAELWFLGMQSLSNILSSMEWIVEFIVDSGWPQEIVKSLSRIVTGAIDANTRTAYEDFLCCLVKAQPKVKDLIKENGGKQTCRTHSMRQLLALLNAPDPPAKSVE